MGGRGHPSNSAPSPAAKMAEFFSKGPQSSFTKMSKQFAQEQVMQQAIQDYAEELKAEEQAKIDKLREMGRPAKQEEDSDEFDFSDDDEISNRIMEERMAQMREQADEQNSWKQKGHGELMEITEEDFLKTVTKSHFAVVHFYFEPKHAVIIALKRWAHTSFDAIMDAT